MAGSPNTVPYRHTRIEDTALPYVTNTSVIDPKPHFILGSHDALTSIDGTVMQRPGTSKYPTTVSQITSADGKRFFFWQSGSISYSFMSVVTSSASKVYKIKHGTDTAWQLLHTDSSSTEPFDYVISHSFVYFANGTDTKKYNGTTVSNWGITVSPTLAITSVTVGAAGNVPNHIGHDYVFAYGVSTTGYLSDISLASSIAPAGGEDSQWAIVGPRCTDTQCDKVHIFRTEDGGATLYELSNSPIANPGAGTWTITDNDADEDLDTSSPAPLRGVNAAPPALFQPTIFAGRIWGYVGDRVWRSTLEENNTSVPEECFGQQITNSYAFGRDVTGIGVAGSVLVIYCNKGVFKIGGDSLVTFYRDTLSRSHGTHYRQNIEEWGDGLIWLDSSNKLMATDGDAIGKPDISLPIRPDLDGIDHSQAMVAIHDDHKNAWIVLMDGANETVYVFDTDKKQWMPPWIVADITAVASNAVFPSGITFHLARVGTSMIFDTSVATDADPAGGTAVGIDSELRSNLFPINTQNPTGISQVEYVAVERNRQIPTDVLLITDEKPSADTYTSIRTNREDPDHRTQGVSLIEDWFWNRTVVPPGQRTSFKLTWSADDSFVEAWQVYCIDVVHQVVT